MSIMVMPNIFRTAPRKAPEHHEQNDCITFTGFMQLLAPRHGIIWTHFPAGGLRAWKTAGTLKKMGTRAGVWDYLIRAHGKPTLWIEFKHGTNKLTPEQQAWRFDLLPMGDQFEVAYNPIQALAILTARGFLPPGAYVACGATVRIPLAGF